MTTDTFARDAADPAATGRKVCILLNEKAGTARTQDSEELGRLIAAPFEARGDRVEVRARAPKALGEETKRLNDPDEEPFDLVVLCGGDGTLSRCAADLAENAATLGFLPLGTMNLFARALGLPTDVEAAAAALAEGRAQKIDVGSVNGRMYLHHVSFGLHPRLLRQRETMTHRSRAGKIFAGMKAFWLTVRAPSRLELALQLDDEERARPSSAIVVSNNPFGPGHMPYPDEITTGKLGVYVCHSFDPPALVRLGADAMLGRLDENPDIEACLSERLTLTAMGRKRSRITASVDGELVKVALPAKVTILRGYLDVMVPAGV
ncbi:diacylglycerol kinase family protein [Breoghania sp. L-A4]|uniref:diacylglycerol/lipid kinase family protein n=1 Tax=Breoghania sp. L-A4 TaxID=2304600 RepID=UPI000E35A3FB|nr:diacylglycerol kinase family protein [Breoghania sp. L-A4]AXS40219.1 hypothetical protein D1F64_09315 [Breoghania sp. L-A4]